MNYGGTKRLYDYSSGEIWNDNIANDNFTGSSLPSGWSIAQQTDGAVVNILNNQLHLAPTATGEAKITRATGTLTSKAVFQAKLKNTSGVANVFYINGAGGTALVNPVGNTVSVAVDIYLNGVKLLSGKPLRQAVTNLGAFYFYKGKTTGELFVDDVKVYSFENPYHAPQALNASIIGTMKVGQTVDTQFTYSDADGDAQCVALYQWYYSDSATGTYYSIPNATSKAFVLDIGLLGQYIKCRITPIDQIGLAGNPVYTTAVHQSSAPVYNVNDNFNSGSIPSGWTSIMNGDATVSIADVPSTLDKSLKLSNNASSGQAKATRSITLSGKVVIEGDVRNVSNGSAVFYVTGTGGGCNT